MGTRKFNSSQKDLPQVPGPNDFADRMRVHKEKVAEMSNKDLQDTHDALAYGISEEEPTSRQQEMTIQGQFQNVRNEIIRRNIEAEYKKNKD